MGVTRNREVGEMGKCWSKGTKLQLCRMNMSRGLMYSPMAILNNTVLNTGNNAKRVEFRCLHHRKLAMSGDTLN